MKTKSENRRALPKFILLMVVCALLGGVIGMLIVSAEGDWTADFTGTLHRALALSAPWLLVATDMFGALGVYLPYRKAKRTWNAMTDPEDEDTLEQVDHTLERALLVNNVCSIFSYFLLAAALCGMEELNPGLAILALAAFVFAMVSMMIGQQKIVDFTKKLYPEKRGSVYDTKFAKTWYESCDEAERTQICQAAFTSYKATTLTCVLLWMVLVLSSMLFDTGLLPIAMVSLIWLVSTLSYSLKAMQLGKRHAK